MRMRRKAWTEPLLDNCAYLANHPRAHRGHWRELFAHPEAPLHLEIGCGKGVSTVKMAHANPDVNYVAIDEVRHVLAVTIKNAAEEYRDDCIDNLALSAVDAMFITDTFAPEDRIARIYIHFPNPWNEKAKQHKRRLTHPRQLMQYRTFLAPNGEIFFKTDDETLFLASKRYLADCGFEIVFATDDLHASGFAPNYISEHEAHYLSLGMKIHFLIARMAALPAGFIYETEGKPFDRIECGDDRRTSKQAYRIRKKVIASRAESEERSSE